MVHPSTMTPLILTNSSNLAFHVHSNFKVLGSFLSFPFHMIPSSVTLFFIFSLTATLLLPTTTTHHVNFNTFYKKYSNNDSTTTTSAAEIVDKDCSNRSLVTRSLTETVNTTDRISNTTTTVISTSSAGTVCSNGGKNCTSTSSANSSITSSSSGSRTRISPFSRSPSPSILPSPQSQVQPPSISISISPTTTLLWPSWPPALESGNHQFHISEIVIGVTGGVMGGLMICIIIYCLIKVRSTTKSNQDIEAFLKTDGAVAQKRYKFSEVKKMTNSFKVKLGQGGFGAVYKGKLPNGCHVAVKLLNASKGNGKDFINEVASISRTSHVNIVTLVGFCLEGRNKALIYEFMANGSLDKFIYKIGPEKNIASLSWENLYQISLGIAQGLEYLHRGCNTRILHFDIKPHNILLDENFCPKISDFGLAKLCPRNESIISMSDQRGTMGYIAPEMCNRHFGGISHKSDVYSYGMMLLEMVGGRKNINVEASNLSELYFPHVAHKRLEVDNSVIPNEVMSTEENEIAKRMTIVGLWCIQSLPNDRPTMNRVVDMLEDNMNSLEMPPKPMLSSPTTAAT